jgi:TDG/mug DNA glycosylase family protein
VTDLPLLPDRLSSARGGHRTRALFVGINPGVRSALLGHHFAGHSNRFWKLLSESGLTPRPATFEDDVRMPEWGYGMTNLVPRPTPGIADLTPDEYRDGRAALERKIRRARPELVVLIGVSLARALLPELQSPARSATRDTARGAARDTERSAARGAARGAAKGAARATRSEPPVGLQRDTLADAPVFVLPNPSGRNAHYSYARMLDAFRALKTLLDERA